MYNFKYKVFLCILSEEEMGIALIERSSTYETKSQHLLEHLARSVH